jgi:adenylate cyclase
MYTDMVGYTALTQSNEAQAMQVLERHNRLLRPFFPRFHGREVKAIGDSFLVEFDSALDALNCASEIQSYLHDYNVSSKEEWKIRLRIGIHLGDVIHKGGDVFGDAVNIASRIYPLAEPEGVCVSDQVFGQVRNKVSFLLEKMAPQSLKNVQFPVDVYRVAMPWDKSATEETPAYIRALKAIMLTDIVGYSSLFQKNEALALQLLQEHRRVVRSFFQKYSGREVKTMGDAFLVEFASSLEAVKCAFDIQRATREANNGRMPDGQVQLRIGVHLGEVLHDQNDVLGHAVNVASRIELFAMPGGIVVSQQVYDHIKNNFEFPLTSIGKRELKGVGETLEVFRVVMPWEKPPAANEEVILPRERIAILPFANMSPDPNDEYFADGMTEEIISTVSGISGLKVISRTSVMGYKGTTKKVEEIGRELKVGSVLEGSFRKAGNRIRVTTQLIKVSDDEHLWAQNYDRDMDDVFEVQSDVAKQVADALRVRILTPEIERIERKPTENATSYALYLKGRYLWNKRTMEEVGKAIECFEQALKEDPAFALGYVGIADCCLILANNFGVEKEANKERAQKMLNKALELDPGLAEAHATKGFALLIEDRLEESKEEFEKSIELKPSYATAHHWYRSVLHQLRSWDEALEHIQRAVELDPLSAIMRLNLAESLFVLGRAQDALRTVEEAERINPDVVMVMISHSGYLAGMGRRAEAAACLDRAARISPDDYSLLDQRGHIRYLEGDYNGAREDWEKAVLIAKKKGADVRGLMADFAQLDWTLGDKKRTLDYVSELQALPEDPKDRPMKLLLLSAAYMCMCDPEKFFPLARQLVEGNLADFGWLKSRPVWYPFSQNLFKDPRWEDLFRSVGLEP